jgi:MFS superfamily sulfate permease-like transporter
VPVVPGGYSDLTRHPENKPVPGVLIVRVDGALYFANALTIRERVKAMIEAMEQPPKTVILDVSAQDQLDLTSTDMLKSLVKELQGKGMTVMMADVHTPVREFSRKTGLLALIGEERLFPTVELAVQQAEASLQAAQAEGPAGA